MGVFDQEKLIKDRRVDERVVAIVRHHWFVLFRDIVGILIAFLLPFFIVPLLFSAISATNGIHLSTNLAVFFVALWALLAWHVLFARWTDYYFDIWIITNLRIVDVDQIGFFHRDTTTLLDLDHIQDMNTQIVGVVGNLLNFGTLRLQTAAAQQEFFIEDVPNPQRVEQMIRNTQLEHAHRKIGEV